MTTTDEPLSYSTSLKCQPGSLSVWRHQSGELPSWRPPAVLLWILVQQPQQSRNSFEWEQAMNFQRGQQIVIFALAIMIFRLFLPMVRVLSLQLGFPCLAAGNVGSWYMTLKEMWLLYLKEVIKSNKGSVFHSWYSCKDTINCPEKAIKRSHFNQTK